ncbi:MAG: F0F1 ATP synthase subunit epsilon [Kiloniellales bacterium]
MADRVEFELVSPERLVFSEPVEMVVVPGAEGDFGVLPGHTPMISTVRPGVISIYESGEVSLRIFVAGGFAEVTPERCTVLAESAVPLDEIDRVEVERRIASLGEEVTDAFTDEERATWQARLDTARAMLASLDQYGGG